MGGPEKISPLAVSIDDAYRALGIGRTMFFDLMARRELSVIKIGRRTMVPCAELDRFIAERMQASPTARAAVAK